MGWHGDMEYDLESAAEQMMCFPEDTLGWYLAMNQWNDTLNQIGYDDNTSDFEETILALLAKMNREPADCSGTERFEIWHEGNYDMFQVLRKQFAE